MFAPLLDTIDLTGCVVTADAMRTQKEHARYLVEDRSADYLLIVKANQPTLHTQLRALPWAQVPAADTRHDRGHGRVEHRSIKVVTVSAGLNSRTPPSHPDRPQSPPHHVPALEYGYRVRDHQRGRRERRSGRPRRLGPPRGHWSIENSAH